MDASPAVKQAFADILQRLDRLGVSNASAVDLKGQKFLNGAGATHPTDYVTLAQLVGYVENRELVRDAAARAAASASGDDTGGGGGGGGGGDTDPCDPTLIPPPGAECPGFFVALLSGASATNCWTNPVLEAIEGGMNTNDFTTQRDSGCVVRPRQYHQSNHALWGTFCGQPDCSAVADYHADVSRGDGGWSWVVG